MVGEVDASDSYKLFTHKALEISYNGDRIIKVTLASQNGVELRDNVEVKFTYSVRWIPTTDSYETRFDHYLDDHFFKHQIHWFSVFNSFMMVVFLVGLVAMILMRTLRNDYARFARNDDLDEDERVGDERGWKQVREIIN